MIPSGWLDWVDSEAMPRLLIWRDLDSIVCRLGLVSGPVETRLPIHGFGATALSAWLAECGFRRDQVIAGPWLGRGLFFVRDLSVPKQALAALPKILDQEVSRRTPFELSEIWHAATPSAGGASDVPAICHWIIRKDRAEAALVELGMGVGDIDFIATSDANGESVPVIPFHATGHEDPPWARRAVKFLAVAGLAVAIFGFVAFELSQASVARSIEASLLEAREGALGDQGGFNQSARLFALKADGGILQIWDELSRVLPDHTFLTEIRIADGKVTLSGFSADAGHLVRVIDQSPLFSDATLDAAITPDVTEHKDRFSISFRVRAGQMLLTLGRARSPS